MQSTLLYGCETWTVRVADERVLAVIANDNIHQILHERYCVDRKNYSVASVLLVCRRSSPNAGLATLRVNSSGNSLCPHHLARVRSELEAN